MQDSNDETECRDRSVPLDERTGRGAARPHGRAVLGPKDAGAWTIPKGEYEVDDDAFTAACREFEEEVGVAIPATEFTDLGTVHQSAGKVVRAWAAEGDVDPSTAVSNTFEIEWPPKSGEMQTFPELDRVQWFDLDTARPKIVSAQREFLDRLVAIGV